MITSNWEWSISQMSGRIWDGLFVLLLPNKSDYISGWAGNSRGSSKKEYLKSLCWNRWRFAIPNSCLWARNLPLSIQTCASVCYQQLIKSLAPTLKSMSKKLRILWYVVCFMDMSLVKKYFNNNQKKHVAAGQGLKVDLCSAELKTFFLELSFILTAAERISLGVQLTMLCNHDNHVYHISKTPRWNYGCPPFLPFNWGPFNEISLLFHSHKTSVLSRKQLTTITEHQWI